MRLLHVWITCNSPLACVFLSVVGGGGYFAVFDGKLDKVGEGGFVVGGDEFKEVGIETVARFFVAHDEMLPCLESIHIHAVNGAVRI